LPVTGISGSGSKGLETEAGHTTFYAEPAVPNWGRNKASRSKEGFDDDA
jgi:hypothetical protein